MHCVLRKYFRRIYHDICPSSGNSAKVGNAKVLKLFQKSTARLKTKRGWSKVPPWEHCLKQTDGLQRKCVARVFYENASLWLQSFVSFKISRNWIKVIYSPSRISLEDNGICNTFEIQNPTTASTKCHNQPYNLERTKEAVRHLQYTALIFWLSHLPFPSRKHIYVKHNKNTGKKQRVL